MNVQAIKAIYFNEMARTRKTLMQSIASPVISTVLYFVVFGSAIGSRIQSVEGVDYGSFIVPGLVMLSLLTQSISNCNSHYVIDAKGQCEQLLIPKQTV